MLRRPSNESAGTMLATNPRPGHESSFPPGRNFCLSRDQNRCKLPRSHPRGHMCGADRCLPMVSCCDIRTSVLQWSMAKRSKQILLDLNAWAMFVPSAKRCNIQRATPKRPMERTKPRASIGAKRNGRHNMPPSLTHSRTRHGFSDIAFSPKTYPHPCLARQDKTVGGQGDATTASASTSLGGLAGDAVATTARHLQPRVAPCQFVAAGRWDADAGAPSNDHEHK